MLKQERRQLFRYLDALQTRYPSLAHAFHPELLLLYADFCPERLLDFLRVSTNYPLATALSVCRGYGLIREQVYVLGRMGRYKDALAIMTEQLDNIHMVRPTHF